MSMSLRVAMNEHKYWSRMSRSGKAPAIAREAEADLLIAVAEALVVLLHRTDPRRSDPDV